MSHQSPREQGRRRNRFPAAFRSFGNTAHQQCQCVDRVNKREREEENKDMKMNKESEQNKKKKQPNKKQNKKMFKCSRILMLCLCIKIITLHVFKSASLSVI